MKTVAMLGHGAFGTAMATVLSANGHQVLLWCYESEDVPHIRQTGCNARYLPQISLSKNIIPTADINYAVSNAEFVIEAIPVVYLREVLQNMNPYNNLSVPWIVLSKGIEQETLLLPAQIIQECIGSVPIVACAGPNFAQEIAQKKLSAADIASPNLDLARECAKLFENTYFRTHISSDLAGVQIAGACKNVYSIGIGIARALSASENTIAFFITSALYEVQLLCQALGAQPKTAFGLSGLGDLSLSVLGSQSRNVEIGTLIGAGNSLEKLKEQWEVLPEGINSIPSVNALAAKNACSMPLSQTIEKIVFGGIEPNVLLSTLSAT